MQEMSGKAHVGIISYKVFLLPGSIMYMCEAFACHTQHPQGYLGEHNTATSHIIFANTSHVVCELKVLIS